MGLEGGSVSGGHLAERLARFGAAHAPCSPVPTAIPRLSVWCSDRPAPPVPALFEPRFYLLVQGRKRLVIGGRAVDFVSGIGAAAVVGMPFQVEVTEASQRKPYLGVGFDLDAGLIANLLLEMPDDDAPRPATFAVARVDDVALDTVDRVLRLLASPADIPTLAPIFERELFYRLLQGPFGGVLRQMVRGNRHLTQIKEAAEWIRRNANEPMRVGELASLVGMSPTSFHRHFKAATAYTPLAYQRHIRLLDARKVIASGTANVTTAAFRAGYASASQFSREYKRMFGVSPIRDAKLPQR
jgi:AraC-like DNA-binding protein